MARPKIPINWELVRRKMEAGCNASEIVNDLEIDRGTFYDRFKEEFGENFTTYSTFLHSIGKGNIKLIQYERALEGNTQMLTLLGQEWLGQGKQTEQIPPKDTQIDQENNQMEENHRLRQRIAELEAKFDNQSETRSEL